VSHGSAQKSGAPQCGLRRFSGWLERIELGITALLTTVILVLVTVQVISRNLMPVPLFWLEEVAQISLVWVTFVGAAYASATATNLSVTSVVGGQGERFRRMTNVGGEAIVLACVVLLIEPAMQLVRRMSGSYATASGVPRSLVFLAVVVGFGLIVFHSITNIVCPRDSAAGPEVEP
jgi:TRAP-type transport system small permease protein